MTMYDAHKKEELKKKDWQAIQERLRERINGFASKVIKWSMPIVEQHGEKIE